MRLLATVIVWVFGSIAAWAQSIDGNALMEMCEGSSEAESAFCWGYVFGANDGGMYTALEVLQKTNDGKVPSTAEISSLLGYCTPNAVTSQQMVDIFVSYLRENPERRHQPAQVLFTNAMTDAFPCR